MVQTRTYFLNDPNMTGQQCFLYDPKQQLCQHPGEHNQQLTSVMGQSTVAPVFWNPDTQESKVGKFSTNNSNYMSHPVVSRIHILKLNISLLYVRRKGKNITQKQVNKVFHPCFDKSLKRIKHTLQRENCLHHLPHGKNRKGYHHGNHQQQF